MKAARAAIATVFLGACAAAPPSTEIALPDNHLGHGTFAAPGIVNVLIEIPAGTTAKWEASKAWHALEWQRNPDGELRNVDYLAYPANYGIVWHTLAAVEDGGDGDPLDVVVLGDALVRGALCRARPIGVLFTRDGGETDDKIIAVLANDRGLGAVTTLDELRERYPGALAILETWFANYKGPGVVEVLGVGDAAAALERIEATRLR